MSVSVIQPFIRRGCLLNSLRNHFYPLRRNGTNSLYINKASGCCKRYSTTAAPTSVTPVFLQAERFGNRTAFLTPQGQYTYQQLLDLSASFAQELNASSSACTTSHIHDKKTDFPLEGERIAFLCENDVSYVIAQWASWMCKAIAVPLCKSHPASELQYVVEDSQAYILVGTEAFRDKLEPISASLGLPLIILTEKQVTSSTKLSQQVTSSTKSGQSAWTGSNLSEELNKCMKNDQYKHEKAMIVYTSGTTGRPKVEIFPYDCFLFKFIYYFSIFSN